VPVEKVVPFQIAPIVARQQFEFFELFLQKTVGERLALVFPQGFDFVETRNEPHESGKLGCRCLCGRKNSLQGERFSRAVLLRVEHFEGPYPLIHRLKCASPPTLLQRSAVPQKVFEAEEAVERYGPARSRFHQRLSPRISTVL
jgi:hypothetical protein